MDNFFSRTFFLEFLPLRFLNLISSSVSLPYARKSTIMWLQTVVLDFVSELQFHANPMPLGTWFLFKEGFFYQSRHRSQGCSPVNSQTTFLVKTYNMTACFVVSSPLFHPFLSGTLRSSNSPSLFSLAHNTPYTLDF